MTASKKITNGNSGKASQALALSSAARPQEVGFHGHQREREKKKTTNWRIRGHNRFSKSPRGSIFSDSSNTVQSKGRRGFMSRGMEPCLPSGVQRSKQTNLSEHLERRIIREFVYFKGRIFYQFPVEQPRAINYPKSLARKHHV